MLWTPMIDKGLPNQSKEGFIREDGVNCRSKEHKKTRNDGKHPFPFGLGPFNPQESSNGVVHEGPIPKP